MKHRSPAALLQGLVLVLVSLLAACTVYSPQGKEYAVRGQVLRVDTDQRTVTLRHDDIEGFMPAMTMPFKVKDASLLSGRARGDLVTGTLFVTDTDAYLTSLKVVGHGEVTTVSTAPPPPAVDILQPGAQVPDAELIDSDGRSLQIASLKGSVVALTFIYTRCPLPEFCPAMDRLFSAAAHRVRQDAGLRAAVRLLSISFDPEYDTPSVLAVHGRAVGADGEIWRFATAKRSVIDSWAPRFGVVVMREDADGITHNLRTAVLDRGGRLVKIYNGTSWTVDELMSDLRRAGGISD